MTGPEKQALLAQLLAKIRHRPREEVLAQLRWIAQANGYKNGFAAYKFKEIYSSWPNRMDHIAPELPSVELQEWVYREKELRSAMFSREKAKQKRLNQQPTTEIEA